MKRYMAQDKFSILLLYVLETYLYLKILTGDCRLVRVKS